MEELFPKQDSTKKPAIIVKRILSLLETGELKPGDKLPNELEIVKQSDISRTSVREAPSALENMGIIVRVPGEGTFIAADALYSKFGQRSILEKFLEDTENVNGSFEALEARMVFEPSVAVMAARRAEPEQIAKMEELLSESQRALSVNDINLFFDIDSAFHLSIAEASDNEEILNISRNLLTKADTHMWRRYKEDLGLLESTIEAHKKIVEAIKERDPQKAGYFMEHHLAKYVRDH